MSSERPVQPNTPNSTGITKTFTPEETKQWYAGLEKRFASAEVWCETPEGMLLIVKSPYKRFWSVPGGIIDEGETPKRAAVREVQEEVGIMLDPEALEFVMVVDRVLGRLGHNFQFVFRTSVTREQIDSMRLDPGEITESAFVTRDDVPSDTRMLGATIHDWASGATGYSERVFSDPSDADDV